MKLLYNKIHPCFNNFRRNLNDEMTVVLFLFDEITAITPLGSKQAKKFFEIENFRMPGVIAVMSSISIYKVPDVIAVKMLVL